MFGYMSQPHRDSVALCQLTSVILDDVPRHYSQFWCFENVCTFPIFVSRLLCGAAPLVVCIRRVVSSRERFVTALKESM
jgi:hypothetical protein